MLNYNESDIQATRREEMLRQAQMDHAAAEVQHGDHPKTTPFYATSLALLGEVMIEVGSRLQDRYGELVEEVQQASEATQRGTTAPKAHKIA